MFCEVAVVVDRGFEVSMSFCWVDEAIVEMREVRRRRVDGSGSGWAIGVYFFFPGLGFDEVETELLFSLVE